MLGLSLLFLLSLFYYYCPSFLKKLTIGFRLTGTDNSSIDKVSEYVWSNVLCSLGVNGFLMLLDSGNMGHVFVEKVLVFAPNPNIGRFRMF